MAAAAAAAAALTITQRHQNLLACTVFFVVTTLKPLLSRGKIQSTPSVRPVSIVNQDKRIVGIGYNGFPMGCSDDDLPWARQAEDELDTKYPVRRMRQPALWSRMPRFFLIFCKRYSFSLLPFLCRFVFAVYGNIVSSLSTHARVSPGVGMVVATAV